MWDRNNTEEVVGNTCLETPFPNRTALPQLKGWKKRTKYKISRNKSSRFWTQCNEQILARLQHAVPFPQQGHRLLAD